MWGNREGKSAIEVMEQVCGGKQGGEVGHRGDEASMGRKTGRRSRSCLVYKSMIISARRVKLSLLNMAACDKNNRNYYLGNLNP